MLALLEVELGVTAAVSVVQKFPLKRKKEAQVNEFYRKSNSVSQLLTFPP